MHHAARRFVLVVAVATWAASWAPSQQITRVTPEVGAPGDIVIISGTSLGAVTEVRFGAEVGGFAGFWVQSVAPFSVSPTTVVAVVPVFGNFLPPDIPFGSSPVGTVDVGGPGFANSLTFFYMEQTAGQLDTPGVGTTQGGLAGRPVIGFRVAGGAPVAGNASFTLTLENATPSAAATLVLGAPANPPALMYLDGIVGIDLLQPILFIQPPFPVDASGDVVVPVPIPAGPFGVTIAAIWVIADPVSGAFGISDTLAATL
jgi:hypothetical protein